MQVYMQMHMHMHIHMHMLMHMQMHEHIHMHMHMHTMYGTCTVKGLKDDPGDTLWFPRDVPGIPRSASVTQGMPQGFCGMPWGSQGCPGKPQGCTGAPQQESLGDLHRHPH